MKRPKTKGGKYRFNLELTPRDEQHPASVVALTDAASNTEAIRRAIRVLMILSEYAEQGYTIHLRKRDGTQEIQLLLV